MEFLFFGALVVVFVEDVGANVHAVADHFFGRPALKVVGDCASADWVWADGGGAGVGHLGRCGFTGFRVSIFGAVAAVDAGAGVLVGDGSAAIDTESALGGSEEGHPFVVVALLGVVDVEPVVENLADAWAECDQAFTRDVLLQCCSPSGAVADGEVGVFWVVVVDVDTDGGADTEAEVPEYFEEGVFEGGVSILLEVGQDLLGLLWFEKFVAGVGVTC